MTSDAQIEANRRNAELSTGPKTKGGRMRARRNALKHGLTARQLVIFDERQNEFLEFYRGTVNSLTPQGAMEHWLVQEIAIASWRLMRLDRFETQLFTNELSEWQEGIRYRMTAAADRSGGIEKLEESVKESVPDAEPIGSIDEYVDGYPYDSATVFRRLASSGQIEHLSRYRTTLERSMYRALDQLERLQARRKGLAVAPPHVVDVRMDEGAPKLESGCGEKPILRNEPNFNQLDQ